MEKALLLVRQAYAWCLCGVSRFKELGCDITQGRSDVYNTTKSTSRSEAVYLKLHFDRVQAEPLHKQASAALCPPSMAEPASFTALALDLGFTVNKIKK